MGTNIRLFEVSGAGPHIRLEAGRKVNDLGASFDGNSFLNGIRWKFRPVKDGILKMYLAVALVVIIIAPY